MSWIMRSPSECNRLLRRLGKRRGGKTQEVEIPRGALDDRPSRHWAPARCASASMASRKDSPPRSPSSWPRAIDMRERNSLATLATSEIRSGAMATHRRRSSSRRSRALSEEVGLAGQPARRSLPTRVARVLYRLRAGGEIPARIADLDMPKINRKNRQPSLTSWASRYHCRTLAKASGRASPKPPSGDGRSSARRLRRTSRTPRARRGFLGSVRANRWTQRESSARFSVDARSILTGFESALGDNR